MTGSTASPLAKAAEPPATTLALAWLERDSGARAMIDDSLRLIWTNRAAEVELARRNDIERRDGNLACTDPGHHQQLLDWLDACGSALCSLAIASEDGDGHLLLRAQEIGWADGLRYFGITFHRSGSGFVARYADLDRAFQLTQAEHRVLVMMLDGQTADEVARGLRVSIETTRSHIRQIYAKLGVTSREALFSRVRPYRI